MEKRIASLLVFGIKKSRIIKRTDLMRKKDVFRRDYLRRISCDRERRSSYLDQLLHMTMVHTLTVNLKLTVALYPEGGRCPPESSESLPIWDNLPV